MHKAVEPGATRPASALAITSTPSSPEAFAASMSGLAVAGSGGALHVGPEDGPSAAAAAVRTSPTKEGVPIMIEHRRNPSARRWAGPLREVWSRGGCLPKKVDFLPFGRVNAMRFPGLAGSLQIRQMTRFLDD